MTTIKCPACATSLKVKSQQLGKSGQCPKCQHQFSVAAEKGAKTPQLSMHQRSNPVLDPRRHHYIFSHQYLPKLVFSGGEGASLLLSFLLGNDESRARGIRALWDSTEQYLDPEDIRLPFEGIACSVEVLPSNTLAIVFELPTPVRRTEPYFVAIVLRPARSSHGQITFDLDYFTLELGFSLHGDPYTVLGGWTKDGSHLNYEDGLSPNIPEFLFSIDRLIQTSR